MKLLQRRIAWFVITLLVLTNILNATYFPLTAQARLSEPTLQSQQNSPPVKISNIPSPQKPFSVPLAWGRISRGQEEDALFYQKNMPAQVVLPDGVTVRATAAGDNHSVALTTDGRVYAWGSNALGQLGDGSNIQRTLPVATKLPYGVAIQALGAGNFHNLAVTTNGRVLTWGQNGFGQLGDNSATDRNTPVYVNLPAGVTIKAVAGGFKHSLALSNDGKVYAWGDNASGQLGDGSNTQRLNPVLVNFPAGTVITAIAAGYSHNVAVSSDGKVYGWGLNDSGILCDGSITDKNIPININLPPGVSINSVAAGFFYNLFLTSDGKVLACGQNGDGQLGDSSVISKFTLVSTNLPTGITITSVAAHSSSSAATSSDGRVFVWGINSSGQSGDGTFTNKTTPVAAKMPNSIFSTSVTMGDTHVMVVTDNNLLYSWGDDFFGQLGDGYYFDAAKPNLVNFPTGQAFSNVDTSGGHSLALTPDGKLYAWGMNGNGQLGDGTTISKSKPVPVAFPLGVTIKAISSGIDHSLAVSTSGGVWVWGANKNGVLGAGNITESNVPIAINVPGVTFVAVSANYRHSLALSSDGKVYAWGLNMYGAIGDGTNIDRNVPVLINIPGQQIVAISAGFFYSLALTTDGKVFAWGINDNGQLGNGSNINTNIPVLTNLPVAVTQISAGGMHSIALTNDGRILSWGSNAAGQLGTGTFTPRNTPGFVNTPPGIQFKKALGGSYFSMALTTDGKVYGWGDNAEGQLGDTTTTLRLNPVPASLSPALTVTDISAGSQESTVLVQNSPNIVWPAAQELNIGPGSGITTATVEQFVLQPSESKWFRFKADLDSKITLSLSGTTSDKVLPANFDLSLYRDIGQTYEQLKLPQNVVALSASDLPVWYMDAGSLPVWYMDAGSLPVWYMEGGTLPVWYMAELGQPDVFTPDGYDAQPYSGAIPRSLIAISAQDGLSSEQITRRSWDNTGYFYVRVNGRGGTSTIDAPFRLQVTIEGGTCAGIAPVNDSIPVFEAGLGERNKYKTLILTDSSRAMEGNQVEKTRLATKLASFNTRPEVSGLIVDLARYPRVVAANQQADAHLECPYAKNFVANEIKKVINSYSPTQYIVLVGGDDVIPFFRYPDLAGLVNEKEYFPPVADTGALQSALRHNLLLNQDAYGSVLYLNQGGNVFPLPGLAVGRLNESAAEITNMLDAYVSTNGVITPRSALVTGYSFVTDAATAVKKELESAINSEDCPNCTRATSLISPENAQRGDSSLWSAAQLRPRWLEQRNDIVFLAGHFSAGRLQAADNSLLSASELAASQIDQTNSVVLALGCHSGYGIPDSNVLSNATPTPDWPQAFATKGITAIAGTGYQYGDTEFIEYSEKLYQEIAIQMHTRTVPAERGQVTVPIGTALVRAKQHYLATTAQLNGTHEKALLVTALYGLPMMSVTMTGVNPPGTQSDVQTPQPVTGEPGRQLGLTTVDYNVIPSLTRRFIDVPSQNGTRQAEYLASPDGALTNPLEPRLPVTVNNVSVSNTALRGVGFRSGSYTDRRGVFPLTVLPVTEFNIPQPEFRSKVFNPPQPWMVNYFDTLAGGSTRLAAIPAQFRSEPDPATGLPLDTGTLRRYRSMDFKLYYSNNTSPAAVVAQPIISKVSANVVGDALKFSVKVAGDPTTGMQNVWITYTASRGAWYGSWQSLDLNPSATNPGIWEGSLPFDPATAPDVYFMVQAANGVGMVSLATNLGAYYAIDTSPAITTPPLATKLFFVQLPGSDTNPHANYLDRPTIKLKLETDTSPPLPLAGQSVTVEINGQHVYALTDSAGIATVNDNGSSANFLIRSEPGIYQLNTSFSGSAGYRASFNNQSFTVNRRGTNLILSVPDATVQSGTNTLISATLKDQDNQPLSQKIIYFVATAATGEVYGFSALTDSQGRASLDNIQWPGGSYSLRAYFGNSTGGQANDDFFQSATAAPVNLIVKAFNVSAPAPTISQSTPINQPFPRPLQVVVKDSSGKPLSGVVVLFTAPATGASGYFISPGTGTKALGITNSAGLATAPTFIANGQVGTYTVTGSVSGVKAATFNLTNTAGGTGTPVISGQLWSWGANDAGQLGNGTTTTSRTASRIPNLASMRSVVASGAHTLALKTDGTVWAWGANNEGQLGTGDYDDSPLPRQVKNLNQVIAIAAGENFSLAIRADGTVWAWGVNNKGQLGTGNYDDSSAPVLVKGLSDVITVAAGNQHSLAVRRDGTVWAWGEGSFGRLGTARNLDNTLPARVSSLSGVTKVAAGSNFSLALKSDGTVWAWGANNTGQLGGNPDNNRLPSQIEGLSDITALGAGQKHSLAVKADGTVWAWGDNNKGQLGTGTHSDIKTPAQVRNLDNVREVSAGLWHSLAVKADGTVWAWGDNNKGQLGDGSRKERLEPVKISGPTGAVLVAAGSNYSLVLDVAPLLSTSALTFSPQLTGSSSSPQNLLITNISSTELAINSVALDGTQATSFSISPVALPLNLSPGSSATVQVTFTPLSTGTLAARLLISDNLTGSPHTVTLSGTGLKPGTAWAWGRNDAGQLGNGTNDDSRIPLQLGALTNIKALVAGQRHSLALKTDGTVWAWGDNDRGQLGISSNDSSKVPVQVKSLNSVIAIAVGHRHSLAIKSDGTVWAWGEGGSGRLGRGNNDDSNIPVQVKGLSSIIAVSAGQNHSLAVKADGTVWAWGDNDKGQLGTNDNNNRKVPVQINELKDIVQVVAGSNYSLAVKADGTVWAWGDNDRGQLGTGDNDSSDTPLQVKNLTKITTITAGWSHNLALKSDGTVWAWGEGGSGRLGIGNEEDLNTALQIPGLNSVTLIAAGNAHSLAVKTDGTLWVWGEGNFGRLGTGNNADSNKPVQVRTLAQVVAIAAGGTYSLALVGK